MLFDEVEEDAGGEGSEFFGGAMEVPVLGEDQAAGMPEVGAEGDVGGVRKRRIQTPGCFGSTIAQRPAADRFGSTIKSPPQPAGRFFWPTEVQSSSASTNSTSSGLARARALPSTSSKGEGTFQTVNRLRAARGVATLPKKQKLAGLVVTFCQNRRKPLTIRGADEGDSNPRYIFGLFESCFTL